MAGKQNEKSVVNLFIILLMLILLVISGQAGLSAFADTAKYTSVTEDLQKVDNFNLAGYTDDPKDYTIKVIQIAESSDKELFIYTYQACQRTRYLVATNINISLSESVNGTKLYKLRLLNVDGVLCKYLVEGLTVSGDETRYYNITSIYRAWDYAIDEEAGNNNKINGVAYAVGQTWKLKTVENTVKYEMTAQEVIKVISQMIGMRRYSDGFQFANTKACDSHYIAFTCDHKIDKLLSADIEFKTTHYKTLQGSGTTYGEPVAHSVTLYGYQVASNDGSGWFGKKEEWHRMTSINKFVSEVEMSETEKETLSAYDWILNFYETDYTIENGGKDVLIGAFLPFGWVWNLINALTTTGEIVSEVALLRLEFDYNSEIYNLGVVANIQTGSNKPTNPPIIKDDGCGSCGGCSCANALPWWAWLIIVFAAPLVIFILFKLLVLLIKKLFRGRNKSEPKPAKRQTRRAGSTKPKRQARRTDGNKPKRTGKK